MSSHFIFPPNVHITEHTCFDWILLTPHHSSSHQQGDVHEMCHKKQLTWCRSLYISMKLAKNAMLGCIFVTYTDICKHIMFTV